MHVLFNISEKELLPCSTAICFLDILKHCYLFRIRLQSYFSAGGKWNEWENGAPSSVSPPFAAAKVLKSEWSEQKMHARVLKCLNWKKWWASWGSAAKGETFHLYEKLFKNICCPDARMGCVRRVLPNTGRCKVKGRGNLWGNSFPTHLGRLLFRIPQNCAL